MEALTDGIFAIAMTLLVLELKVPDMPKHAGAGELLHKIGEEMPELFSFFVSFLYCGLLWVLHHLGMHFIRHLQIAMVWLNLMFLMSVSVMPFFCGLLGHFLHNRAAQEIYYGNMFLAATLLAAQWLLAKKRRSSSMTTIHGPAGRWSNGSCHFLQRWARPWLPHTLVHYGGPMPSSL